MSICDVIKRLIQDDPSLAHLFERAQEYAQLYLLANQRQKGCDEMGEVATLKDEFVCLVNDLIRLSQGKGYISGDIEYDIDATARAMAEME